MANPLRIRSPWLKFGFVAMWFLTARLLVPIVILPSVPWIVVAVIVSVLDVAAVVFGARTFRSRGEDPAPPRPGWQLTGRPLAGFVIATIIIATFTLGWLRFAADPDGPIPIFASPVMVIIAGAYVYSSRNLLRRARRVNS